MQIATMMSSTSTSAGTPAPAATAKMSEAARGLLAREVRGAQGKLLLGGTVSTGATKAQTRAQVRAARRVFVAVGVVGVLADGEGQKRSGGGGGGGGGGAGPMRARGNATVYLAAWPQPGDRDPETRQPIDLEIATRATTDRHDQAHTERDRETGLLVPAALAGDQARPRRYPPSHFNGRGVAIDSSFDELYERLRWMEQELGGVAGMGVGSLSSNMGAAIEQAARKAGSSRKLRSVVEGKR